MSGSVAAQECPPENDILFADDFSGYAEGSDGSPAWNAPYPTFTVESGAYEGNATTLWPFEPSEVVAPPEDPWYLAASGPNVQVGSNFVFEAKVQFDVDADVSLAFRHHPIYPNVGYVVSVQPRYQWVGIVRLDGATNTVLDLRWDREWSSGVWYKFTIVGTADTIEVYLDDEAVPLLTATDSTYQSGGIGLTVLGPAGATAYFDDIIVCAPETLVGDNVVAGTPDATVEFAHVTAEGMTQVTTSSRNPAGPTPSDFRVVGCFFLDITTTATYSGPVTLGIRYYESEVGNEACLQLFHWDGAEWQDVTTSIDTDNNIIYGQISSLSPFFVAGLPAMGISVGGIVKFPAGGSDSSSPLYAVIIGGAMAALAALALGGWFVRRRRLWRHN
jgi:hypothetical protein